MNNSQNVLDQHQRSPMVNLKPIISVKQILQNKLVYDENIGFYLHFDNIINLPKQMYSQVKVVYAVFNEEEMLIGNKQIGPALISVDPQTGYDRAIINIKHNIKLIEPNKLTNLIFEVQVPKERSSQHIALGWSLINLFDLKSSQLNSGFFKVPLYSQPTVPSLSVNEISSLSSIGLFLWLRISMPGDSINDINILKFPADYKIPKIHENNNLNKLGKALFKLKPKLNRTQTENYDKRAETTIDNKADLYSTNGVLIYLHYFKDINPSVFESIFVKWTLLKDSQVLTDNDDDQMIWNSKNILKKETLEQNLEGQEMMKQMNAEREINQATTVLPILDKVTWVKDFYNMLLSDDLKSNLYLNLSIYANNNKSLPIGSTTLQINNEDGTIKYGTFDLPLYEYSDYRGGEIKSRPLGFSIVFILNNPKNIQAKAGTKEKPKINILPPKITPTPKEPVVVPKLMIPSAPLSKSSIQNSKSKRLEDFEESKSLFHPKSVSDEADDENNLPYIINSKKQYDDVTFDQDNVIVLSLDSCRFLPENVSVTKLTSQIISTNKSQTIPNKAEARILNENFDIVNELSEVIWDMNASTDHMPVFGLRIEFSKKTNPNLDASSLLIIKIITIDRLTLMQRTVGYSFFPLFIDRATGEPARNIADSDFALNSGAHQIPIYSEEPKITNPLTFQKLWDIPRIPCATILFRLNCINENDMILLRRETSLKTNLIKPMLDGRSQQKDAIAEGFLKSPPSYESGVYWNRYINLDPEELTIYKNKNKRRDAKVSEALKSIKEIFIKDKRLSKLLKKKYKKKNLIDITNEEILKAWFSEITLTKEEKIDLNFFSQYISEVGFKFSLDMVFNWHHNNLYAVICSINPPGGLYKKEKSFEKVIMFNDIDFNCFLGAQKFYETFYNFKNVPADFRAHMIIDIKSIKFQKNNLTEVKDYAWSIFPLFTTLDTDKTKSSIEIYVRTGIFVLPLFSGSVRADLVDELKLQDDVWDYWLKQNQKKVSNFSSFSASSFKKSAVILRCIDNQREGHLKEFDHEKIDYRFWEKNKANFEYNEKVIKQIEKRNKISILIPPGRNQEDIIEEITKFTA